MSARIAQIPRSTPALGKMQRREVNSLTQPEAFKIAGVTVLDPTYNSRKKRTRDFYISLDLGQFCRL
jgi:hypothetical protein